MIGGHARDHRCECAAAQWDPRDPSCAACVTSLIIADAAKAEAAAAAASDIADECQSDNHGVCLCSRWEALLACLRCQGSPWAYSEPLGRCMRLVYVYTSHVEHLYASWKLPGKSYDLKGPKLCV